MNIRTSTNRIFNSCKSFYTSIKRQNHLSAYDLTNYRSLVSVKGPDSDSFLQNLITNDIRFLKNDILPRKSIYSMILNSRGRIMYDVIVYRPEISVDSNEFLVELDFRFVNDAMKLFKMLKVKKKVILKN
jgi:folate-binding Fe-S cluster repair protein YgfZ